MHCDKTTLAGTRQSAIAHGDHAPFGSTRHADRGIVLLRPVDPVGKLVVDVHAVNLCGHLVVNRGPRLAPIEADIGATIVSLDHPLVVLGIDPQVVVVPMRRCNFPKTAAAIG